MKAYFCRVKVRIFKEERKGSNNRYSLCRLCFETTEIPIQKSHLESYAVGNEVPKERSTRNFVFSITLNFSAALGTPSLFLNLSF